MRNEKRDLQRASALVTAFAFALGVAAVPAASAAAPPAQQAAPTGQSPLVINHDELPCVVTDFAPTVDAQVAPAPQFDKGYVYFKAAGTEDFYYTPMKGAPDNLEGVLPRPLPETKAIDYKVRARDTETLTKETREYVPPVVPGNTCKTKGMAVPKEGAGLTIGLTREGQNPVPPGFNKNDIAFVILTTGAVVGIAAALKGGTAGSGHGRRRRQRRRNQHRCHRHRGRRGRRRRGRHREQQQEQQPGRHGHAHGYEHADSDADLDAHAGLEHHRGARPGPDWAMWTFRFSIPTASRWE